MTAPRDAPLLDVADPAGWRAWLDVNHATARGAWLLMRSPRSAPDGVDYEAAVEEALCFGWIDSTSGHTDDGRTKLYFAPRRPTGVWAASNKARVERLLAEGRMAPAGLAAIERAKASGAWELLDSAERLEVPEDLDAALRSRPPAAEHFAAFPASARKAMLGWVALARRPATRQARITRIAETAARNERVTG